MVNKKRSSCWNTAWYLTIFYFAHVICYIYLTKINLSIYLYYFYSIFPPTLWWTKKKTCLVVIYVYWIIFCSEIFLSQDDIFQLSTGCTKKILVANHGGKALANTNVISQFRENSNFHFLINTLIKMLLFLTIMVSIANILATIGSDLWLWQWRFDCQNHQCLLLNTKMSYVSH